MSLPDTLRPLDELREEAGTLDEEQLAERVEAMQETVDRLSKLRDGKMREVYALDRRMSQVRNRQRIFWQEREKRKVERYDLAP